jgi:hypothetical protein
MEKVISISESVAPIRIKNDACEVWASADAVYDEAKSRLEVKLDSYCDVPATTSTCLQVGCQAKKR